MTRKEAILVSAYTGYLLTKEFSDVHEYCEKLTGRPMYTHEFADSDTQKETREKCKPFIIDMINNEDATKYVKVEDVNKVIDRFTGYLDEDMIYRIKYKIKQFADTVTDV